MEIRTNVICPHCGALNRVTASFETSGSRPLVLAQCHPDDALVDLDDAPENTYGCGGSYVVELKLSADAEAYYTEGRRGA